MAKRKSERDKMIDRWSKAIKDLGGYEGLLALPKEIGDLLSATYDLERKVILMEFLVENKDSIEYIKKNPAILKKFF